MEVTVRGMREADDAVLDELYAHEEVSQAIWTPSNAILTTRLSASVQIP